MKMFDLEKFTTGKYYVHLPTQELYDEVMEFLDKNGVVWAWSRKNLKTKTYWDKHKEKLSINFNFKDDGIKYGRKSYYEEQLHLKELKINKEENTMKLEDFIKKHGNVNVDEKELKKVLGIKDEKYFVPDVGERYFVVGVTGEIIDYFNNTDFDIETIENNEVFKTKEEAEEHAEKQRFLLQMKRDFLDNSDKIDWENDYQEKYNIYYNHTFTSIKINATWKHQFNVPVTTDREWLEEYIEKHEEEIKKYYFEIKEDK